MARQGPPSASWLLPNEPDDKALRRTMRSGSVHPRTRLILEAVVVAILATFAFVWYVFNRPGGGNPNNPPVQLTLVQTSLAWPIAPALSSDGRVFFAGRDTRGHRNHQG